MSNTKKADILFLSMILIHIGVIFLFRILGTSINISTNQSLILSQLLILVPATIFLLITKTNPIKLIRFKKIDIATIGMVILLTILLMPLITFINALSMLLSENAVTSLTNEMKGNSLLLNLILMAVIPALSEEFVFRGVLFHTYRKSSVLYGAILSGLIFGLMHLNFNQFSYAFVLGIIFAMILEATGSIYATMIAHFVINGNSVVMMEVSEKILRFLGERGQEAVLQTQYSAEELLLAAGVYGIIAVGTTALAIGVYLWIVKHCDREKHVRTVIIIGKEKDKFDIKKAISIWLIISVVACIAYMGYYETNNVKNTQENTIEQNTDNAVDNTLRIKELY